MDQSETVEIRGYSDDTILVNGVIDDEFWAGWENFRYLHFADGTVVTVGFGVAPFKGWSINVVVRGGSVSEILDPVTDDGVHFSDRLRLNGPGLTPVRCWNALSGPSYDEMVDFWGNFIPWRHTKAQLHAALLALDMGSA